MPVIGVEAPRKPHQLTNRVVMIRPDHFAYNAETAVSNSFQNPPANQAEARARALTEFEGMVGTLREAGIRVTVLPSRKDADTPDAVFPNNWFSTHEVPGEPGASDVVLYPMLTPNRREERQIDALRGALTDMGLSSDVVDMTGDEANGGILEGTGSLVLDRANRIAYALESPRTTKEEFDKWADAMAFDQVFFHAVDTVTGNPIYHTNVVMSVGDGFSVLCSDAIPDVQERAMVEASLEEHGELIRITPEQMNNFAGNILQVRAVNGDSKIIMSQTAFEAFTPEQRERMEHYGDLVPVEIPTIEFVGGGSARCMVAEVFPPLD